MARSLSLGMETSSCLSSRALVTSQQDPPYFLSTASEPRECGKHGRETIIGALLPV